MLRISRKTPVQHQPAPSRVGVDDFAFRKGRRYGIILIDLDRHQPIDVLPDREGKTLEAWFRDHPGIELVTAPAARTRSRGRPRGRVCMPMPSLMHAPRLYNRAAGAVADRWHLLANLSEVVERFLDTQRDTINQSILATLPATDIPTTTLPLSEE